MRILALALFVGATPALFAQASRMAPPENAAESCQALERHGKLSEAQACYANLSRSADPLASAEGSLGLGRYDEANDQLQPLRSFVLPGGSRLEAELHICRTVCRRAERILVRLSAEQETPGEALRYLNRLSDALFVWSRWANHSLGAEETIWEPNAAASARMSD